MEVWGSSFRWITARSQFWTATIGLLLYIMAMWTAGITQGLMWRDIDNEGRLTYSFVETVIQIIPMYYVRAFGGVLIFIGFIAMVYNLWKTIKNAPKDEPEPQLQALPLKAQAVAHSTGHRKLEGLTAEQDKLFKMMGNHDFLQNAPDAVVNKNKARLEEITQQVQVLNDQMSAMK